MRRPVKALLLTLAVYLVYAVIVWLFGGALGLGGLDLWVFRGGFLLLGAAAAALVGLGRRGGARGRGGLRGGPRGEGERAAEESEAERTCASSCRE